MDKIVQVIQSTGFPIFCVLALGYFYNKQFGKFTEAISKFNETVVKFDAKLDALIEYKESELK